MKRIAILASGTGTNADRIARYFAGHDQVEVTALLTNRAKAPVVEKMQCLSVPVIHYGKEKWLEANEIADKLRDLHIDLVVLAGFLAIIGDPIIDAFHDRIINIHPSLLPKFGGKGMWGNNVHEAVIAAGEKESGITIHYVTKEVDGGEIIEQHSCPVMPTDTPDSLAARVHQLEYEFFPKAIERLLTSDRT